MTNNRANADHSLTTVRGHPLAGWHRFVAKSSDPHATALPLERNVGLDARKLLTGAKAFAS